MSTSNIVMLGVPLVVEGETITELSIRRPKVRDLRVLEEVTQGKPSQLDQGAALLSLLAGIPEAAVEEMDATDFARASEVIAGFFEGARVPAAGGA
jgi:hypothetical protein